MDRHQSWCWGLALGTIATLNILGVLPDWTTITAALALPAIMGARCRLARHEAR